MLGVVDGVPKQTHTLSLGAPQARRQQRLTQGETDGLALTLDVCVGAVPDGVGVTQRHTVFGHAPVHCQFPPTQGVTEGESETLGVADSEVLSLAVPLGEALGDADGDGEALLEALAEELVEGVALVDGEALPLAVTLGLPLPDALTVALPLTEALTLALEEVVALCDGVCADEGETEPVAVMAGVPLGEAEAVSVTTGVTLGEMEGVPLQMQTPLAGAPQATKQHSCGQTVIVTLGEMVGVAVVGRLAETEADGEGETETVGDRVADTVADTEGTVGEGELLAVWLIVDVAEMQTQTMFGKVPVQL
jgi:hypothetical protein